MISVVVPVYNEEENIERCIAAVEAVFEPLSDRYRYEIVFTDNHSTDDTFGIIRRCAAARPTIRAVRFSRNFGYQNSILTGYSTCAGDAAIQLDVDLEDPPELIPEFLKYWEEGYKVVYGIRKSRHEGWMKTLLRKMFYRIINRLSADYLPPDAGDFRLLDRIVIDQLPSFAGSSPYLRGTIASLGFRQKGIEYDRSPRVAGVSKFNFFSNLSLAFDGIVSQSLLPLRFASVFGLLVGAIAILFAVSYAVLRLRGELPMPPGFATLIVVMLLGISFNALFLGVIGEYLGRVLTEARKTPHVAIEERIEPSSEN